MRKRFWLAAGLAALALRYLVRPSRPFPARGRRLSGCGKGALDFEYLTPGASFVLGTTYTGPALIYSSGDGLAVGIAEITLATGAKHFELGEIVNTTAHPFGKGQTIHLNNTALIFDLKRNTRSAEFEYLDQGGTINLGARGSTNVYVGSMDAMPVSMVINGVQITKTNVQEFLNPQGVKVGERGTIRLTYSGDIGGMIIGGQEMHLDNFCFD